MTPLADENGTDSGADKDLAFVCLSLDTRSPGAQRICVDF